MSKRLIMILALAFVVGIAFTAYAEVQNVKVSGDLLLDAINRSNFTLTDTHGPGKYKASGLTSQLRLRFDADLTDNVSTTVRLINESSWGQGLGAYDPAAFIYDNYGSYLTDGQWLQGATDIWDHPINVDLAYVTLKEFLYSPLTLTLGRQELRFGNALIIGNSGVGATSFGIPFDLSLRKSFDAIRANLDYNPWVLDIVYAKINENDNWWLQNVANRCPENNDADLMGINAAWDMKAAGIGGKTELYFWRKENKLNWADEDGSIKKDVVNTVGALVSGEIRKNLTGSLEAAWQFGTEGYDPTYLNETNAKRHAMALQAMVNYAFETKNKTAPTLGLSYTYLSGDNKDDHRQSFWDPMFEDQRPNEITNAIFPNSGVMCLNVMGSIKPREDLTLALNYGYYLMSKKFEDYVAIPSPYGRYGYISGEYSWNGEKELGQALDLKATYDYTEDVQLGLAFGLFTPGKALKNNWRALDQTATQLIGSMKVTF